jgi:hypothetical protein
MRVLIIDTATTEDPRQPISPATFHVRPDYVPLYPSLSLSLSLSLCVAGACHLRVGAGRAQVGGDEKNSFMSRGIITEFYFFFSFFFLALRRARKVAGSGMTPDLAHSGRRTSWRSCARRTSYIESLITRIKESHAHVELFVENWKIPRKNITEKIIATSAMERCFVGGERCFSWRRNVDESLNIEHISSIVHTHKVR